MKQQAGKIGAPTQQKDYLAVYSELSVKRRPLW